MKPTVFIITVHTALACTVFALRCQAADWPNWRGPDRNGISQEIGWSHDWPGEGPRVIWRVNVGTGFSSMAVADGKVYTMGNTGGKHLKKKELQEDIVYCFDAESGKPVWQFKYKQPLDPKYYEGGTSATPTLHGGRVYTISKRGIVHCLNAFDGKRLWRRDLVKEHSLELPTWGLAGSPRPYGDLLLLNAGTHGIALKLSDGSLAWSTGTGKAAYSTPVIFKSGGRDRMGVFGEKTFAVVDVLTGEVIWTDSWKAAYDENIADPLVIGDRLFVSSSHGKRCSLFRIEKDGLTELWRNKNMLSWMGTPVFWKGHLYGIHAKSKSLRCTELETGEEQWSKEGFGQGQLMMADGKLIVIAEDGRLIIAEATPDGYRETASTQLMDEKCWTVPVLSNGRIYVRDAAGNMACVDVNGK